MDLAHQKEAEHEGEQEDQLKKDEREQHVVGNLLTGFGLSSHSVQTAIRGQTLANADSEAGDTDGETNTYCNTIHFSVCFILRFSRQESVKKSMRLLLPA